MVYMRKCLKNVKILQKNIDVNKYIMLKVYRGVNEHMPPLNGRKMNKMTAFLNPQFPFKQFLKKCKIHNQDFREVMELYRHDKTALVFLDPPYVNSCNDFYSDSTCVNDVDKFYTYLLDYIETAECRILMIVNDALLMRLLFKKFIKHSYPKQYEMRSKKCVNHLIITNYWLQKND